MLPVIITNTLFHLLLPSILLLLLLTFPLLYVKSKKGFLLWLFLADQSSCMVQSMETAAFNLVGNATSTAQAAANWAASTMPTATFNGSIANPQAVALAPSAVTSALLPLTAAATASTQATQAAAQAMQVRPPVAWRKTP
jgi:hypothetical protein